MVAEVDVSTNGADEWVAWLKEKKEQLPKFPGFFAPYKSPTDFAQQLISPVGAPIILGVCSAVFASISSLATVVCLGSFLYAVASAVPFKHAPIDLSIPSNLMYLAGACAALALVTALLAIVCIPSSVVILFTRSGASIAKAAGCFTADSEEPVVGVDSEEPVVGIDSEEPTGLSGPSSLAV